MGTSKVSKSKTFPKESDFGDLMDFVTSQIEIQHREIPCGGAEPYLDIKTETVHKYIITVTKVTENDRE